MHTLLRCDKITNTHTHMHTITGLFQVFNKKKTGKQEKRRKTTMSRRRYCLLLRFGRTSKRTGSDETTKRKLGRLVAATEREKSACMRQ
jgi:hypothetical protein